MANILLVETGLYNSVPNPINRGNNAPPFALECLAGYLIEKDKEKEKEEHKVRIVVEEQLKKEDIPDYDGENIKISSAVIAEMVGKLEQPVILGIRAVSPLFSDALDVARDVKELFPDTKIIVGGYHASGTTEYNIKNTLVYESETYNEFEQKLQESHPGIQLVDCFAFGEGEATLEELVRKFSDSNNAGKSNPEVLSDVEGVVYRDDQTKQRKINEVRPRLGEYNEGKKYYNPPEAYRKMTIPIRDEEGNIVELREISSSTGRLQTGTEIPHYNIRGEIQLNYTRGCPHQCSFCASVCVWNNLISFRDPKMVVAEAAKYNYDQDYRTNYIYFADLTFNLASKPLTDLADAMKNVRLREDGTVYHRTDLTEDEVAAGLDNGRKVFGHDNNDQIHWFGLAQAFRFVGDGKKIVSGDFRSKLLADTKTVSEYYNKLEELWNAFPKEFWEALGYSGDNAVSDFYKDVAENAPHLYDNLLVLSDSLKKINNVDVSSELTQNFTDYKDNFAAEFFGYLGFPKRDETDPKEVIHALREAGCSKLGIGVEGVTRADIVEQKGLDEQTVNGITSQSYSPDAIKVRGNERFAQVAMTFHTMKQEGMFTRGYFIWGSENQNKYALDRAKLIFSLEIPDKIYENFEALKKLTGQILDEVDKYYPEARDGKPLEELPFDEAKARVQIAANQYLLDEFKPKEDEEGAFAITSEDLIIDKQNRFMDIDHLRIGYETPYLGATAAKKRKMRCAEAEKDENKVLKLDQNGKLIFKRSIMVGDEKIILDCPPNEDNVARYYYPDNEGISEEKRGQAVEAEVLETAGYIENMEVKGETLYTLVKDKGWDDWRYLFQECPVLDCDVPLDELITEDKKLVDYFYRSDEYRRSIEHRVRDFPEQKEACYAWDIFWEEAKKINFLDEDIKLEMMEQIIDEAGRMDLDKEQLKAWLKERIMQKYMEKIEELVDEVKSETTEELQPPDPVAIPENDLHIS